ncbi:ABC transporter-like protein [Corchorus capsularis]|uniref:ABC transporter-like protein n=1 Tax=Corchorus capsularis TaxID=210143 RepID=A0A1R3K7W4_COCAP|nr:ABC transporter-like protein [Corchorus capsularis]
MMTSETMELPIDNKIQYTIKTQKLSYWLSQPVDDFSWFFWKNARASRKILKNVNCVAKPGEMMAIVGPSGAGKSTLLDVLAGMIPLSKLSGNLLVNNKPMDPSHFRRVSGYVTQGEVLFPLLTVEETLMYSARLRLRDGRDKAAARVKELLEELGLEHVANIRVGGESNRGISGGEKRRVSIGVDLVHDPAVLLIDEPTSGLDSASALDVVLLLKSMAVKQSKTIVMTIHQPGSRILELFDQVLLLSNGTVLHQGSLSLLEQRLRFAGHLIPRHVNVLEYAMEATEALLIDADDIEQGCHDDQDIGNPDDDDQLISYVKESNLSYANSLFKEVLILGQRFTNNICRTKELFVSKTLQSIIAGIVLGTLFMNAASGSELQTQIGLFAFTLTFLVSSSIDGLPIYLQERRILMRETSRGAYRISSYVISNTLVFLPFLLIVALLYTVPVYWLVGLKRDMVAFLYFSLVVWMVLLMSNSFAAFFCALVPNFITGTTLINGLIGAFFLFSGYFIVKEDIPSYWIFMHYLSFYKYPFESFMINEYGGDEGQKRCLKIVGGQCYLYGKDLLMQQGLKESQKWINIIIMLSFIIGYRILSILILTFRSYRTKG